MNRFLLLFIASYCLSCNSGDSSVNQTFSSTNHDKATIVESKKTQQTEETSLTHKSYSEPYLRQLIAAHFHTNIENINNTTSIVNDLHGDSIDVIELTLEVERSMRISIPDGTIAGIKSVGDFYATVLANK